MEDGFIVPDRQKWTFNQGVQFCSGGLDGYSNYTPTQELEYLPKACFMASSVHLLHLQITLLRIHQHDPICIIGSRFSAIILLNLVNFRNLKLREIFYEDD